MAEMYQPTTCEEKAFAEEEDEDAGEKGTNTVEAIGEKGVPPMRKRVDGDMPWTVMET